jgi:hypothetical protein
MALATTQMVLEDPHRIPGWACTWDSENLDAVRTFLDDAANQNAWAVLIFHKLVDRSPTEKDETSREAHGEILSYLASRREQLWTAPFRDVYRFITRA